MQAIDVCIRGAGIVGMSLALALSRQGLAIGLVGAGPDKDAADAADDLRTYALNAASRGLLSELKVWPALPIDAITPVRDMRVHGDALDAKLSFSAPDQAQPALAWIVDAQALMGVLRQALQFAPGVQWLGAPVAAPLQVLAEGRALQSRAEFGIHIDRQPYGHSAMAARLVSDRPHAGCAWQWFGNSGVLALLPFDRPAPGCCFGLVWSLPADHTERLLALEAADFERELNTTTNGSCGVLRLSSERALWPLALQQAHPTYGAGFVAVGDAAHVVHPLAGQGLNLGLADVAALAKTLAERESWRALGDERLLARYARQRRIPTWAMSRLTDGMLHLFAAPAAPLRELRNRGLTLVEHLPPLKRWLTGRAAG
ncbi:MAG: FAD-dependent monooxygenase [Aquabacterium sp.]